MVNRHQETALAAVDPPGTPRLSPRRFSPGRRAFFRAVEETAGRLGGRAFYRRFYLARGRFRMRTERVAVPELPSGLDGFRVAHLSDFHAGPFLKDGDLREVVRAVNGVEPDLVVLTGDLVTRHWSEALLLLDDLASLASRHGTFGVFGNHDYHDRMEGRIASAFAERGIRFLRNESVRIDTGAGVLAVVGIEDLEEARVIDVAAARAGLERNDVELLLCHNPHGAPALVRAGCAAILSGHTHGHQVDLPGFRRLGSPHPGDRLDHGRTAIVTSRGLGVVGVPFRIGSPAEVVLLEFAQEGGRAG